MKKSRTDKLYDAFKKSATVGARLKGRVAEGRCARCNKNPHSVGEGSTSWYCAECAELNRIAYRTRTRLRDGKPLSDPVDTRGRKRRNPKPE
jgi:hypothetical protein